MASLQGCDVVRASWLTDFEVSERTKASEAMQLLKEANRMIDLLDRDYAIYIDSAEVAIEIDNATLYSDDTQIELDFLVKSKAFSSDIPLMSKDLIDEMKNNEKITLFVATTDSEMDLLFKNNSYKQKLVRTLTHRFTEATVKLFHQEENKGHHSTKPYLYITENNHSFFEWVKSKTSFSQLGITTTQNNKLIPNATITGFILPNYIIIQQK
ncbi:MAG: hypothetical protein GX963_08580 [Bacteroidales bacterium]|nr:hypothetical protein [Bacteroidales bacterium]